MLHITSAKLTHMAHGTDEGKLFSHHEFGSDGTFETVYGRWFRHLPVTLPYGIPTYDCTILLYHISPIETVMHIGTYQDNSAIHTYLTASVDNPVLLPLISAHFAEIHMKEVL